jgi:hypothetical protein
MPGRYRLQLFLPLFIKDEAESVKFSSRKQPPTLTVTLAVDSSLVRPAAAAACVRQAQPVSAPAGTVRQSSSTGSQATQQGQHQQQQQRLQPRNPFDISFRVNLPARVSADDVQLINSVAGPMSGNMSTWLWPYAVVGNWLHNSGANAALKSLLWMLNPNYPSSPGAAPDNLLPLTARNVVLALLAALLGMVMILSANAYTLVGLCVPQRLCFAMDVLCQWSAVWRLLLWLRCWVLRSWCHNTLMHFMQMPC